MSASAPIALAFWLGVAFAAAPVSPGAGTAPGTSFEELAGNATEVVDLGMLVTPFVDDCREHKGEVERARCLVAREQLREQLPARKFMTRVDGGQAISLSAYDARIRGLRLTVAGCLACKTPVDAGGGERRLVTLKVPKGALPGSVEIGRTHMTFPNPAEANTWARSVKGNLRAEFVFRTADAPWTAGRNRGYAWKPLGFRVVNRCTGEVVFSQPPSRGPTEKSAECAPGATDGAQAAAGGDELGVVAPLDPVDITKAMDPVRGGLDGCLRQFPMPGTPLLAFEVAANGRPHRVTVEGSSAGTALAQCLVQVAMQARFPASGGMQRFKFPVLKSP